MRKIMAVMCTFIIMLSMMPMAFAETDTETDVRATGELRTQGIPERLDRRLQYEEARERYQDVRTKVVRARAQAADCIGNRTDECQEVRAEIRASAQPLLDRTVDLVMKALERMRQHVLDSGNMNEEHKARLLASIDGQIETVIDVETRVDALGENATNAEIRAAAAEVRDVWRQARATLRHGVNAYLHSKLGNLVMKAEHVGERLESIESTFEENGKDTSTLARLIASYNGHVATAKAEWESAVDVYENLDAENIETDKVEVRADLDQVKSELMAARADLRLIIAEIKELNGGSMSGGTVAEVRTEPQRSDRESDESEEELDDTEELNETEEEQAEDDESVTVDVNSSVNTTGVATDATVNATI